MEKLVSIGLSSLGSAEAGGEANIWGLLFYIGLILVILFGTMAVAKKGINNRYFTARWTQLYEHLYLFVQNLAVSIIGPHGRKYVPMVMVFWMMIFVGNIVALFFPTSPTADLSFNLGIAIIAIMYVQWEGIKANGVKGHFGHFAGPKMVGILLVINGMLFVIELVSEMMKMVSLSLRLYGNIHGGHMAAEAMNHLGEKIFIPFGAFLLPVKLLTCVVQALIFCLLFCVYLGLVTHHADDHGDHGHGHDDHGHPEPVAA